MEDHWSPIVLGAVENELWTEVAGLFRADDDVEEDPQHPVSTPNVAGMFGPFTWRPENYLPYTASPIRPTLLRSGGITALWCVVRRQISRPSGGASTRRDLTPLSSCFTSTAGSLSPACSKATAPPAPAAGLRIRVVISQVLPTSAAPNTFAY